MIWGDVEGRVYRREPCPMPVSRNNRKWWFVDHIMEMYPLKYPGSNVACRQWMKKKKGALVAIYCKLGRDLYGWETDELLYDPNADDKDLVPAEVVLADIQAMRDRGDLPSKAVMEDRRREDRTRDLRRLHQRDREILRRKACCREGLGGMI